MPNLNFSQRSLQVPVSPIRKLSPFAQAAKKGGIKIYHLNIGDPDIKTPKQMLAALKQFPWDVIRYANSKGEEVLLKSLLAYYHELGFKDLTIDNILISLGGSEAIQWAMLSLCDQEEEMLVFEPFYANYASIASMTGTKLVAVKTSIKTGFHLPQAVDIKAKISNKTKAILISNPSNPTGTIYSEKELKVLNKICREYKLYLLVDEVYREFCYDGAKAFSVLNLPGNHIVVLDSLSKRYSLCGARLGCLVTRNKNLISLVLKFAQARLSAGFIDQIVASKLVDLPKNYFEKTREEYQQRRDLVYRALQKIPGVTCQKPEGAFYLIAKLPVDNSESFAKWLLTDYNKNGETIMLAPANGFYITPGLGRNEVRIAYVINQKDLKRSMEILKKALQKYNET